MITQPGVLGDGAAVVAVDVGGTFIKYGLVDTSGHLTSFEPVPTPDGHERDGSGVAERVGSLIREVIDTHPDVAIGAAGVVVPGIVDDAAGVGIYSENLRWRDAPLRAIMETHSGIPVGLSHDVRSAGYAEWAQGAAAGVRNAAVVAVGTGIAAALFVDGRPLVADGFAGEIGHYVIGDDQTPCACGGTGCIEAIASAASIVRRYTARTGIAVGGAQDVIARAADGDTDAAAVWDSAIDALARGLAALAATIGPEVIVLAGGLARAGEALFVPLADRLHRYAPSARLPELRAAVFGYDAGLTGAALVGRARVESA